MRSIYLSIFLLWVFTQSDVLAQQLQLGGRVGGSTLTDQPMANEVPAAPGGTAGIFAAWQNEPLRLGLRLEVNYHNHSAQNQDNWQAPILATIPLDRQQMFELHTGPYVSVRNEAQVPSSRIRWGFSTGLQINLPLSPDWVLTTQARADQDLSQERNPELTPVRNLSFNLTFGLAYLLRRRKD